jgi:prepilin-type N-terminal cleavage/methylation domain-containing protein
MRRRNLEGFTLLELIVVLVIISIMSALVVPRLLGPMGNLDLKTASKKISASLRYARSQAASEKSTYLALFDLDKNTLFIVNLPLTTGDFSRINLESIEKRLTGQPDNEQEMVRGLKTYKLPDGIRLAKGVSREGEVNSGIFQVFFFPSGGSSGGEITVANMQGRQYLVTVDFITGMVQLSGVAG